MKLMAKIKELLAGREKLARYDGLKKWKGIFEDGYDIRLDNCCAIPLPGYIKEIIVNALDAEIKELDKE